jgi:hypothetical protein
MYIIWQVNHTRVDAFLFSSSILPGGERCKTVGENWNSEATPASMPELSTKPAAGLAITLS